MYGVEQKRVMIETCAEFGHGSADTLLELGHPSRAMLGNGWRVASRPQSSRTCPDWTGFHALSLRQSAPQ